VATAKPAFEILITPPARRDLKRIDRQYLPQIDRALLALSADARPFNSEALGGDYFRLPSGEYRIVYTINYPKKLVYVTRVRHRGEVYRNR
jgi:mRNA-degrading endonuclease RelE of RelBE toxin-antitoxin system